MKVRSAACAKRSRFAGKCIPPSAGRRRRSAHAHLAAAHRAQVVVEAAAGHFREDLAGGLAGVDTVRTEVAEVLPQPAPRTQRPLAAPEREAQRLHLAQAGLAALVAV